MGRYWHLADIDDNREPFDRNGAAAAVDADAAAAKRRPRL